MSDVSKRVEQMQTRLDEIEEEIDEARAEAKNLDRQQPEETPIATSDDPGKDQDATGGQPR
jgi:hypothetical protein